MGYQEFTIEGRNAVIEAYRAGKPIDKLFILDGCQDGPMMTTLSMRVHTARTGFISLMKKKTR